ncbi:MAG: tRNA preQ1(34) S-adenosylmethionine ribosyltransferase-isomerase QueA [Anaerolineales bacterium]|jgi:S-adenosylmethionine:tRNA ribosyltransferase-isomerase
MKTSDFDYTLPPDSIAQTPVEPRDSSRLLVLNRETGIIEHSYFRELGRYLQPKDLLVVNRTRVIPARLFARKSTGGRVEVLLLRRDDLLTWECLVGGKGLAVGRSITIENGPTGEIIGFMEGSHRRLRFSEPIEPYFPVAGHVPLPPYIHTPLQDPERYQTVYASEPGSAAAPTAGLHFTTRLMEELESLGINFAEVTLHVGLDTFAPVTEEDPAQHQIHTEWCEVPPSTVDAIASARHSGGRIIAVGTTSVRTLESAARSGRDSIISYSGQTNLYILPGYRFKLVDVMITNFHLPKSTLIMLVSAFAGREKILQAYEVAVQQHYRFYSFGDAMLIL